MKSPDEFLNKLLGFQAVVDANQVNAANVAIVKKDYLTMPDFNAEKMASKSNAAKGKHKNYIYLYRLRIKHNNNKKTLFEKKLFNYF